MKFLYNGPTSGVTIKASKEAKEQEIMLFDGQEVDLPEDNKYVKTLVARGHLIPIQSKNQKSNKKEVEGAS